MLRGPIPSAEEDGTRNSFRLGGRIGSGARLAKSPVAHQSAEKQNLSLPRGLRAIGGKEVRAFGKIIFEKKIRFGAILKLGSFGRQSASNFSPSVGDE